MNRFSILTLIMGFILALASCDNQKPRQRHNTDTIQRTDSIISMRVSFKRQSTTSTPEVTVKLNGVPFNMMWDTGAERTVISAFELASLMKAGKISDYDHKGYMTAVVADGSSSQVPVFNIREFTLTDTDGNEHTIYNVDVAVIDNMGASLLLGQNVMKELPAYRFNDVEQNIEFYDVR